MHGRMPSGMGLIRLQQLNAILEVELLGVFAMLCKDIKACDPVVSIPGLVCIATFSFEACAA